MKFKKPDKLPSANIKAEIYRLLKEHDIKCCLDYRVATEYGELATFSIVIVKDSLIVCAIIVKSMNNNTGLNVNTSRYKKYKSFGFDLFECTRFSQARTVVDDIVEYLEYN